MKNERKGKLKGDSVDASDLGNYQRSRSDFEFEMKVLKKLTELGFTCHHAGTYSDPVTSKLRQFDIRAHRHWENRTLFLAVECKLIVPGNPLVVSRGPRRIAESFHEVLFHRPREREVNRILLMESDWKNYRIRNPKSVYVAKDLVGKRMDQVSHDGKGGFNSGDKEVFDKFSQATSSSCDLVWQAMSGPVESANIVVPVVVVPDDVLWCIDYEEDGSHSGAPHLVQNTEFFVSISWTVGSGTFSVRYWISHLEIVTYSGLSLIGEKFAKDDAMDPFDIIPAFSEGE